MADKRYIDVDNFIWWVKTNLFDSPIQDEVIKFVDNFPIANVKEVKYGKWNTYNIDGLYECSECKATIQVDWTSNIKMMFCPNCGATMQTRIKTN